MKNLTTYVLSKFGGGVTTRSEFNEICRRFRASYMDTVNFMISYGYLVRILRGLYYVKTIEEFKLRKSIDVRSMISLGMEKLKIHWYFGLNTALKLNGLTHEFFRTTFVINDSIYRPKEIKIAGEEVKFLKLRDNLLGFGVIAEKGIKFSDPEKTILDLVYVFKYRGVAEDRIIVMIDDYSKGLDREKLKTYLKHYTKTVEEVARDAGLI